MTGRALGSTSEALRRNAMLLYLSLGHAEEVVGADGTQRASRVASLAAHMALWMKYGYDLIVGVDLCNEINFGFPVRPSTWGAQNTYNRPMFNDLAYYAAEIRKVAPDVPLAYSVYMDGGDYASKALVDLQYLLHGDFHDIHPYNGQNGKSPIDPAKVPKVADFTTLEGRSRYLGYDLIGECGILNTNPDSSVDAWINGMAAVSLRTKSKGGVMFRDYDFASPYETGAYGIIGKRGETAFASWPNPA